MLDAVADDATIIGAARRAGVIARAGDHRAVGTLDLDEAACEEHWLGSAGRHGATTGWGKYRGERAFGFSLGLIGEAGSSKEDETTAGEDEKRVRSHGSLHTKEASKYRAGTGPAGLASSFACYHS